ncbi:hypothetical protein BC943DRAFT_73292 [Umbelopsis sp. AD052]|nr:hypothetical protein BC943DRAFT_73292 [Umbelopsis sp. AD052]
MKIKLCYFLVAIATPMIIVCGADIDNQPSYAFCNKCIATNICFFFVIFMHKSPMCFVILFNPAVPLVSVHPTLGPFYNPWPDAPK